MSRSRRARSAFDDGYVLSDYGSCSSVDEVFEKYRAYRRRCESIAADASEDMQPVTSFSELEDGTVINQGTSDSRLPQLAFHPIHGQNVVLQKLGRVARRQESFCKGLAFSNRPIAIEENVCIRLTEVATNWSGVLRFGVTNVDPDTYGGAPVPRFVCPDLTSKEGYWAKALPDRFSVEGNILHFYVTSDGELCYGVNGSPKGVFLVGINTRLPLWIIVDIYGNSVAVEFIDPSDFRRTSSTQPPLSAASSRPVSTTAAQPSAVALPPPAPITHGGEQLDPMALHRVTGRHVHLNGTRTVAERSENEYSHGYVFTERPMRNNEKLLVKIQSTVALYSGGIAFGLTCCDPSTLRSVDLPDDSDELIELSDYWVGVKDVALQPKTNTTLAFWITDAGEVKMEKDGNGGRTIMHVDNSLQLYMWFDLYGNTQTIKILGTGSPSVSSARRPTLPTSSTPSTSASTSTANPSRPPQPSRVNIPSTTRRIPSADSVQPFRGPSQVERNPSTDTAAPPLVPPRRMTLDEMLGMTSLDRPGVPPHSPLLQPTSTFSGAGATTGYSSGVSSGRSSGPSSGATTPTALSSLFPAVPTPPARPPPLPPVRPTQSAAPTPPARPPPRLPATSTASTTAAPPTPLRLPGSLLNQDSSRRSPSADSEDDECTVCMSARINSVVYACGHMSMCYECARQTFETNGVCPICREPMKDVIRTFKS